MAFEEYIPSRKPKNFAKRANSIRYNPTGKLSLFAPIFVKHINSSYVKLLIDKDEMKVAIKPTNEEDPADIS